RRGSRTRILRPRSQLSPINARGTRAVLPAPGGATSTADVRAANAVLNSSKTASIGRGVANFMAVVSTGRVRIASTICADHQAYGIKRIKDEVWIAEVIARHRACTIGEADLPPRPDLLNPPNKSGNEHSRTNARQTLRIASPLSGNPQWS